MFFDTGHKST